eukprot:TRINITY_DN12634_c0_g1_i2.p1 TRINITY_DN12634_c0_g1~~TRINITY_DN12634_c0_g1_i2.p1  ORF type:complete len:461 (+),score=102.47 TRINITY_DN12634_c0_g1_i2:52-1383(+)
MSAAAAVFAAVAAAAVPLPTLPQLRYQRGEVVAIFQFSGDRFMDCTKGFDPAAFKPTALNVSMWADLAVDMGARSAWVPVKGFCGFLLWHTDTVLPDGRPYGFSSREAGQPDIVRMFTDTFNARGLGAGAYYDLDFNWYLGEWKFNVIRANQTRLPGQQNVSQSQFESIMFAQLQELWSRYGDLFEIWFDGGFLDYWEPTLQSLLELQPQAAVFNGCAAAAGGPKCVSPNPTCWIGTESGAAPDPTWSTGAASGAGDPNSTRWCPKTADTPLQVPDQRCPGSCNGNGWNYNASSEIKSLAVLIDTYHQSVGHGGTLELNVDMDRTGNPVPSRAERLREFGSWLRGCYGTSVASASGSGEVVVDVRGAVVDRVALQEDLTYGQRVRSYSVLDAAGAELSNGTAIGSKKIDIFEPAAFDQIRIRVTSATATPKLTVSVYSPCPSS